MSTKRKELDRRLDECLGIMLHAVALERARYRKDHWLAKPPITIREQLDSIDQKLGDCLLLLTEKKLWTPLIRHTISDSLLVLAVILETLFRAHVDDWPRSPLAKRLVRPERQLRQAMKAWKTQERIDEQGRQKIAERRGMIYRRGTMVDIAQQFRAHDHG